MIINTKQESIASSKRLYIKAVGATREALIAVRAAKMRPMVGRYSSRLYALNRGVEPRMLRVAMQAEAMRVRS